MMVITVAGFPTVSPIIQNGAVPVFLDVNPTTGNIDVNVLRILINLALLKPL